MKNKGFTVVEFIVSFVLVITIAILLLEMVFLLRNLYNNSGLKTELLNKQSTLTHLIYKELDNNIQRITRNGDTFTFTYNDNTTRELKVDRSNNLITFDDYSTYLTEDSYFGNISYDVIYSDDKKIIKITVPVKNDNLEGQDFGLNIVYQDMNNSVITN